jgi:hypothetical protein
VLIALPALSAAALAADWTVQKVDVPARVVAIEAADGDVRVNSGGLWYRLTTVDGHPALTFMDGPKKPALPEGALPEGRIATGTRDIARAWLAEPTDRYGQSALGGKTAAGSVVIETRDGKRQTVRLGDDSVFEDLVPRLADLDGDGHDEVVLVKSNVKRGSSLAVIGVRDGRYAIVAETPPAGQPQQWLNPAGIADFNGDGKLDIALVRMPDTVGQLELWTLADKRLRKTAELADVGNHVADTQTIDMSAVADFDGDGTPDLAIPSLDHSRLRLISFKDEAHEIGSIALPNKAATNLGLVNAKTPQIAAGLADGSLVLVERPQ